MNETDHKKKFISLWEGWYSYNEPGLGSDIGAPDVYVVPEDTTEMIPVEFKRASWGSRGILFSASVRAAQIRWAGSVRSVGVPYMLVLGDDDGLLYSIDGRYLPSWKEGYRVGSQAVLIHPHPRSLTTVFSDHVISAKKYWG